MLRIAVSCLVLFLPACVWGATEEQKVAELLASTMGAESMCEALEQTGESDDVRAEQFDKMSFEASRYYQSRFGVSLFDALKAFDGKEPNEFLLIVGKAMKPMTIESRARFCVAAYTLVDAFLPDAAQRRVAFLVSRYDREDGDCRGGSGNDPSTTRACVRREKIGALLASRRWCLGEEGQTEAQMKWHHCSLPTTP